MNRRQHWETVYTTKAVDEVSWYRPHLDRSLALIERAASDRRAAVLDVGGGASTLVDDLLARGYRNLGVLDISAEALGIARKRLGEAAHALTWLATDLLDAPLQEACYDVWHDRAVFHFLTETAQRANYVRQLTHALKPGGHAVLATFGPDGPMKCSGPDTMRYDADGLARALGDGFTLIDSTLELHATPSGASQQFLYALFQRAAMADGAIGKVRPEVR
jgi:SAM-dependent methyltransferase